ncbi:MAG: hypothetical protein DRJ02_03685 [Bacteroidetes bacterium]|nr:MAG: hypothetical protein DRI72_05000 [Bacteroidota bacterium]RLD70584.1 MAG: hypothetical protein DRI87_08120 [Bacteroidota bacterium]RLD88526.1 MAG: hypothetical protein DRJ02_03685 [Bacteroidota bacterium]
MKKKIYNTRLPAVAGVFVVLIMMHSNLLAQNEIKSDKTSAVKKQPRTALLMKQSERINQKFDKFFEKPNPKVATWIALVPGLGQIYNKKYWKLPIVYAGFAATGYFAFSNRDYYIDYREAYICKIELEDECEDPLAQAYSANDLLSLRDYYRRNMELSFIIMAAWYVLQILDATVDAHLYYWQIDEETTLSVQPAIDPTAFTGNSITGQPPGSKKAFNGVTVSLRF